MGKKQGVVRSKPRLTPNTLDGTQPSSHELPRDPTRSQTFLLALLVLLALVACQPRTAPPPALATLTPFPTWTPDAAVNRPGPRRPTLPTIPPTATALPIPTLDWQAELQRPALCDTSEQAKAMRADLPDALPTDIPRCYDLTVAFDGNAVAYHAVARIRVANDSSIRWKDLLFRLYPRSPRLYGGTMDVSAVLVNGQPTPWRLTLADGTGLQIPLPTPLVPDDIAEVAIEYTGALDLPPLAPESYGLFTRTGLAAAMTSWYPMLAPFGPRGWIAEPTPEVGDAVVAEAAWLRATILASDRFTLAVTGTVISEERSDGTATYVVATGPTRDMAILLLEGYEKLSVTVDGTTLNSWFLPERRDAAIAAIVGAQEAMRLYNERFGPYPYRDLELVALPLQNYGGMEFPQMVLLEEGLYLGRSLTNAEDLQQLTAHEVAHQWWYGVVGSDQTQQPWLDEGLATWSELLWLETMEGTAAASRYRATTRQTIAARRMPGDAFTAPSRAFPDARWYNYLVYRQGDLFLEAVRSEMGDADFFDALRCYYDEQRYRIATHDALLSCFQRSTTTPLESLFRTWGVAP